MNLKHLKEMDDLRETCEEMSRMLYHRSSSNGSYVNNNSQRRYNDNHDAPNRFRNNNGPLFRNGQQNGRPNRYYNKPINVNENENDSIRSQDARNYGMFNTF